MKSFLEVLLEEVGVDERFIYKVNSKGKKRRKLKCAHGMKPNASGTSCVPMKASEKRNHKVGSRHAVRTVKAKGAALQKRKVRKMKKALRFRKNLGL